MPNQCHQSHHRRSAFGFPFEAPGNGDDTPAPFCHRHRAILDADRHCPWCALEVVDTNLSPHLWHAQCAAKSASKRLATNDENGLFYRSQARSDKGRAPSTASKRRNRGLS